MNSAFKVFRAGAKPPGMWKTLVGVLSPFKTTKYLENVHIYSILWTGMGAQVARWSTLEPIQRRLLEMIGEEGNAVSVLGANFSSGFVTGSLAAAATCPLDVAKTRSQIEKDPQSIRHDHRENTDGGLDVYVEHSVDLCHDGAYTNSYLFTGSMQIAKGCGNERIFHWGCGSASRSLRLE